jgi:Flp pilus assembly protein TadG
MQEKRGEHGAVMVEFALVLVPLVFLVFGFLKFGIAMNAKIDGTHLSAEGARYIAVNQNPAVSPQTMESYIRSKGDTAAMQAATVKIGYPINPATGTSCKIGDPVKVTVAPAAFGSFVPGALPGGLTLPAISVSSDTTMRLEAPPTNIPATPGEPAC